MTILFVCTGNTCRSPLALAAWRALHKRGEVPENWSAFSSGLASSGGQKASRHAVDIARGWGVDLSSHRARAVDAGALRHIDVCVAISSSHARALERMLERMLERPPRSSGKAPRVLCLSDFVPRSPQEESVARLLGDGEAGASGEIADPYGGSREAYESCAELIREGVSRLARHLREQDGASASGSEPPPEASSEPI